MIRFCDRKVGNVEYDSLNRKELHEYFLSGHEEDILCVYDSFESMKYIGIITYISFQSAINIADAIKREFIVLNTGMWQEARKYFEQKNKISAVDVFLPVLDEEYRLICFAYEDNDANREIRMLRELQEVSNALQFNDIFPEYKCVKIYGFNELAFFFAKYLEKVEVAVETEGKIWDGLFAGTTCQTADYECMIIYAEGIKGNSKGLEKFLTTVSVEFECIDKIYEANIKAGIIKDAKGDSAKLLEELRSKEVVILGVEKESQDTYDFLIEHGVNVCCFVDERRSEERHRLFGKKILSSYEVRNIYNNPVFINCSAQNSAWGLGQVDYYDYIGYRRNVNFFLIKDYVDIAGKGLLNALRSWRVVLVGDIYGCQYLSSYLISHNISVLGYVDILQEDNGWDGKKIEIQEINDDVICLIVAPESICGGRNRKPVKQKDIFIEYLDKFALDNFSDYFSDMVSYIDIEEQESNKYSKEQLMPKRIVLGSIEPYNGNVFFEGLLDGHPNIMAMWNCYFLKDNLFWICIRLAGMDASNVLSLFWTLYETEVGEGIDDPVRFNEKMEELLSHGDCFTSQELFVALFISYMYMYGNDFNIKDMIIYWEPHFISRVVMEEYARWLGAKNVPCDIVNVVRNLCMMKGSQLKACISMGWRKGVDAYKSAYTYVVYSTPVIEKKKYKWSDRLVIKFEELKCNSKETLELICKRWGIAWSDTMMATTRNGEKEEYYNGEHMVSDFDLTPVYNIYEKYFSEFDRFRLSLFHAPWQKKYGYPYVELKNFSRREIQEMFLKEFRFESLLEGKEGKLGLEFKMMLQYTIRDTLQKVRILEFFDDQLL